MALSARHSHDEDMKRTPQLVFTAILPTDELIRLGEAAVVELERRGYDVRGKTAAQITKILRFPPPKRKAK